MSKIHADKEAYRYTIKGHTVAVVSDGTAVLGLGTLVQKLRCSNGRKSSAI